MATPEQLIKSLEEPRRAEMRELHELVRAARPELEPFCYDAKTIGYGAYHYRSASGQEGDWYEIGLSAGKASISLHVSAATDEGYLAEEWADRFPKASVGRSCVRFKRLAHVDPEAVSGLLAAAREHRPINEVLENRN
jgi:hypothetical protein